MPSLTDLPEKELRNVDVALKVFEDNFGVGKIHDPTGDGNCGYYALFKAFKFMGKNLAGKKLVNCAQNPKTARAKRIELLNFGKKEAKNFVRDPDKSIKPKIIHILPDGPTHIYGMHGPNLVTDQDKIDAFMATIGNFLYTEEYDDYEGEQLPDDFHLEAYSTLPLICYKYNINITLYLVDLAKTSYCYHHKGTVYTWYNDGLCKPVDKSCILYLQDHHYCFIEGRGTEVPTIDPGEMVYTEDTRRAGFDTTQVDAIQVNEDDEKESDKDSEGNSMEKMPTKKVRKFVPDESDQKATDNDALAKTPDSKMSSLKGETLDDDFRQELETNGQNGNDAGNNDGNVEQPVDKSEQNKSDETDESDMNEKDKSEEKDKATERKKK